MEFQKSPSHLRISLHTVALLTVGVWSKISFACDRKLFIVHSSFDNDISLQLEVTERKLFLKHSRVWNKQYRMKYINVCQNQNLQTNKQNKAEQPESEQSRAGFI